MRSKTLINNTDGDNIANTNTTNTKHIQGE